MDLVDFSFFYIIFKTNHAYNTVFVYLSKLHERRLLMHLGNWIKDHGVIYSDCFDKKNTYQAEIVQDLGYKDIILCTFCFWWNWMKLFD